MRAHSCPTLQSTCTPHTPLHTRLLHTLPASTFSKERIMSRIRLVMSSRERAGAEYARANAIRGATETAAAERGSARGAAERRARRNIAVGGVSVVMTVRYSSKRLDYAALPSITCRPVVGVWKYFRPWRLIRSHVACWQKSEFMSSEQSRAYLLLYTLLYTP